VPTPGALTAEDEAFLAEIKAGFDSVGALYGAVKLKAALLEARRLSQRVNQYLNDQAPWKMIAQRSAARGDRVYVALQAIDWLKLIWAPVLPHSSEQVHSYLGYDRPLFGRQYTEEVVDARGKHLVLRYDHSAAAGGRWEAATLPAGQALREPAALFVKLDEAIMAEKLGT
jgi:methionyl-tRNA synthetase